jgi:hypothetical protein
VVSGGNKGFPWINKKVKEFFEETQNRDFSFSIDNRLHPTYRTQ